ncbi:hypothetical protein N7G274_005121 [Stereocaulon virgatum]|uniref:NADH dehydrogenase [ubiquinone] 1 alpha subcomplex assembly factor 3 n=1 Tax=Stereocaulon virgatum TaxID=373712 RepID=A0ABR4AEW1_9LECA
MIRYYSNMMASPSIPLLRSLYATETIRTSLPRHRHASSLPKALSLHLNHATSRRTCLQCARPSRTNLRHLTSTAHRPSPPLTAAPKSTDRGPVSEESTQTDFGNMDVFSSAPAPTASIDACTSDGFHLDNGVKIGGGSGLLLVAGEAFTWRPWEAGGRGRLLNQRGQWDTGDRAWGILEAVWPKPDLLILGLGPSMYPLAPETRRYINSLGIRVDVQDTRNAAAQFNLLATERGVGNVAAALIPIGWREPR